MPKSARENYREERRAEVEAKISNHLRTLISSEGPKDAQDQATDTLDLVIAEQIHITSLQAMGFIAFLEREFEVQIPDDAIEKAPGRYYANLVLDLLSSK